MMPHRDPSSTNPDEGCSSHVEWARQPRSPRPSSSLTVSYSSSASAVVVDGHLSRDTPKSLQRSPPALRRGRDGSSMAMEGALEDDDEVSSPSPAPSQQPTTTTTPASAPTVTYLGTLSRASRERNTPTITYQDDTKSEALLRSLVSYHRIVSPGCRRTRLRRNVGRSLLRANSAKMWDVSRLSI
jgi:hypothetical protein